MAPRITVVGSLNMDHVLRATSLPREGETVAATRFDRFPGGKGANQAVGCARLGSEVRFVGMVGQDDYGRRFREALNSEGIDTSGLLACDHPTGVGLITLDAQARSTIVVALGANLALTPAHVREHTAAIASADGLILQLEIPMDSVAEAAHIAHGAGVPVVLNAAPGSIVPDDLLDLVDVLVVNEHEAMVLLGATEDPCVDLTQLGRAHRIDLIVMTRGEHGAWISQADEAQDIPAFRVDAIDPVGAGDAFVGALTCALVRRGGLKGLTPAAARDACLWASAAGALATTIAGAIPSLPRAAAVDQLALGR
ncbi:MAG: ribokinase [Phycisphaeraceae bacterium]|nr:ribokinase [Phycisphaeraceae bacterium]